MSHTRGEREPQPAIVYTSNVGGADALERHSMSAAWITRATTDGNSEQPGDSMTVVTSQGAGFKELSVEEGRALLNERAQRYLGMDGDEFVRKWDAGEVENPDRPEVLRVATLLSFVR